MTNTPNPLHTTQALIEFSNAVAGIRHRKELVRIIFEWLRRMFAYDAAILGIAESPQHEQLPGNIAPTQERMVTVFAHDFLPEMLQSDFFQRLLRRKFPLQGTPFEVLMQQAQPLIVNTEMVEQLLGKFTPLTMLRRIAGVKQAMVAPLRVGTLGESGGEAFGFLNLASKNANNFTEADCAYYTRFIDICSVAVRNVFIFEQLESRSVEIALQQKLHLALQSPSIQNGQDIAQAQAFTRTLAETLRTALPFSVCGLFHHSAWTWLQTDLSSMEGFVEIQGGLPETNSFTNSHFQETNTFLGEEFIALANELPFVRAVQARTGIESLLTARISSHVQALPSTTLLVLGERQPYGFSEQDAELLRSTLPHISLSLANIGERSIVQESSISSEAASQRQSSKTSQTINVPVIIPVEAGIQGIIGNNSALIEVVSAVRQVAPTDATVLVVGETGTGKERIARAVHDLSARATKPFVAVNCAALPTNLIESELFGHEKGAFTGATERRIGKFEAASQGGTIFLDEIGELAPEVQAKLLRVLQERELERLGGKEIIRLNVRVVAATNRTLQEEVAKGRFRADLYYRLNVFPLHLPPLRERREDIPHLVSFFVRKYAERLNKRITSIDYTSMQGLMQAEWRGNIRELENVIERSIITNNGETLRIEGFTVEVSKVVQEAISKEETSKKDESVFSLKTHTEAERDHILRTLETTNWRVSGERGAAALLNMKPTTLEYRMKKLGIHRGLRLE